MYDTLKIKGGVKWPLDYQIDAHIHLSLAGRFYRTKDEDFPRKAYLKPDPERQAKWRAWLEQFPKPWVALAWRGGISTTNVVARSINLSEYAPIMDMLENLGVPMLDGILSMPLEHGGEYISVAKNLLNEVPVGITHFILHPSIDTPELRAIAPDWPARVANYNAFMSELSPPVPSYHWCVTA